MVDAACAPGVDAAACSADVTAPLPQSATAAARAYGSLVCALTIRSARAEGEIVV